MKNQIIDTIIDEYTEHCSTTIACWTAERQSDKRYIACSISDWLNSWLADHHPEANLTEEEQNEVIDATIALVIE